MRCYDNELYHRRLHGTIDAERKRNLKLSDENEQLIAELEQVKLELKLERQNKFATNKQKQADPEPADDPLPEKPKKSEEHRSDILIGSAGPDHNKIGALTCLPHVDARIAADR